MNTSFKQLYLQYYAPAKRFATLYVKRSDVAEDVVQDVFLKIYELQKRAPQCNFSMAYVMTSVKHGCISFLRGELLITELEGNYSEVERSEMQWMCNQLEMWDLTTSVTEDTISEIYKAIDALPPQCREIFFRSKIEGKKHAEIAQELNISINTIESQMSIAYRKLRKSLEGFLLILLLFVLHF